MKTFGKVVAWFGLSIVFLGAALAMLTTISYKLHPPTPYGGGVDFGHAFAVYIYFIGLPFMLIGGLAIRPKLFWLFNIIVGCLFLLALMPDTRSYGPLFFLLYGVGIIEGFLILIITAIKYIKEKRNKKLYQSPFHT